MARNGVGQACLRAWSVCPDPLSSVGVAVSSALATLKPLPSLVALVLAGGQSRRMGTDKALLPWQGEPLLSRTCRAALACTSQVYVVTPWREQYRSILPATVDLWPEPPTLEPDGKRPGPLMALASVVAELANCDLAHRPQWVLALACDLPNLDGTALQRWAEHLATLSPSVMAYLPQSQGRWEPLCGFYRVACVASWNAYLATGKRSFQGWLHQQSVAMIPDVNPAWLMNLNTPDDLADGQGS